MKVSLLIFLLVSTSIFAQERHHFFDYFVIENMILGEWELEKTIMVDRDSVHYELLPTSKKSLRIDEKSVTVYRDSTRFSRFYKRLNEIFFYRLTYSEETKSGILSLYHEELKKKRKLQRAWAGYIVKSCDFNQLVLYQIEHSPLSESEFSNYVYYIYKRKQINKFSFDGFTGTWHFFSDSLKLNIGKLGNDIVLQREIDPAHASQFEYHHKIHFQSNILKNQLSYSSNTSLIRAKTPASEFISGGGIIDGVYLRNDNFSQWGFPTDSFWIDLQNQFIYLLHESISVYHFDFDKEGALILSYDENRTKNLKKIER